MSGQNQTQTQAQPQKTIFSIFGAILIIAAIGALIWRHWGDLVPHASADGTPTATYDFACDVTMRRYGDTDWQPQLSVSPGDVVEVRIEYTNLNAATQYDVGLWSTLPDGIQYMSDSTKLYNYTYPSGIIVAPDTVTSDGIVIGDYAGYDGLDAPAYYHGAGEQQPAGANAVVCFAVGIKTDGYYDGMTVYLRAGTENQPAATQTVAVRLDILESTTPSDADTGADLDATPVDLDQA